MSLKKNRFLAPLLLSLIVVVAIACSPTKVADLSNEIPPYAEGVFLDSAVEGVAYVSGFYSGFTDSDGTFKYQVGRGIQFYLGHQKIRIGGVIADDMKSVITPVDLTVRAVDRDTQTTNILRLLQSLDKDGDPSNGILLSTEFGDNVPGVDTITISMSQNAFETAVGEVLGSSILNTGNGEMVSRESAIAHFRSTALANGIDISTSFPPTTATGVFETHEPVVGLTYKSGSLAETTTTAGGNYLYQIGSSISFSLNGVSLGESDITASARMTPRDLIPSATSHRDAKVSNILRVLSAVDSDGSNGTITIAGGSAATGSLNTDDTTDDSLVTAIESVFGAGSPYATGIVSAKNVQDSFIKSEIQNFLDESVAKGVAPGITLALDDPDGIGVFNAASGLSDVAGGIQMTTDVKFRIGSATKTFTAMKILQLIDSGNIALNDPIDAHLPADIVSSLKEDYDTNNITIKHLLTHTSGLQKFTITKTFIDAWFLNPDTVFTPKKLIDLMVSADYHAFTAATLKALTDDGIYHAEALGILSFFVGQTGERSSVVEQLKNNLRGFYNETLKNRILELTQLTTPIFEPGVKWSYSNANYVLLGLIIEEKTGLTWEVNMESIISQLGLADTEVPRSGVSNSTFDFTVPGEYSHGYMDLFDATAGLHGTKGELLDRPTLDTSFLFSAGAIVSTPNDLLKWIRAIIEKDSRFGIIKTPTKDTFAEQVNYFDAITTSTGLVGLQMGLGIMHQPPNGVVGHIGQVIGYDTAMQYHIANKAPIVVFANRSLESNKWHHGKVMNAVLLKLIPILYGTATE